ncbi:MAG: rRNA pseudouridine synthase [Thermoanaerobaculum sp.]|nr:rRNA pseudouridine synthase [Thermoanaerobaculum sp.]
MPLERVQKLIAQAGFASRREAEALIREGRVTVNGQVATLGCKADPEKDSIKVDGKRLKFARRLRYLLLFKPPGVVTTADDPEGRTTVLDLVRPRVPERVFPVGRLDFHSEGLLLLTNDGELAYRLTHPRYGVLREYLVKVRGVPDEKDVAKLRRGTTVEGRRVVPKEVGLVRTTPKGLNSWWRVVVGEGKTHEVRVFFRRIGHPVQRLIRTGIGPLRDEKLKVGMFRELLPGEVAALYNAVGLEPKEEAHYGRTTSTRLHQEAGSVRARQTHRRGATGAGGAGHREARLKRKPVGDLA